MKNIFALAIICVVCIGCTRDFYKPQLKLYQYYKNQKMEGSAHLMIESDSTILLYFPGHLGSSSVFRLSFIPKNDSLLITHQQKISIVKTQELLIDTTGVFIQLRDIDAHSRGDHPSGIVINDTTYISFEQFDENGITSVKKPIHSIKIASADYLSDVFKPQNGATNNFFSLITCPQGPHTLESLNFILRKKSRLELIYRNSKSTLVFKNVDAQQSIFK